MGGYPVDGPAHELLTKWAPTSHEQGYNSTYKAYNL